MQRFKNPLSAWLLTLALATGGPYLFRVTASDGQTSASDEILINDC